MSAPKLLDLFCCQGGASQGYADAGFDVTGVDIAAQPRYPFRFFQGDVLEFHESWISDEFDVVHASPPCQAHTNAQKIMGRDHPDLIAPTRALLEETGILYVIENVPGAPLIDPIELCGSMFGIETYRHRIFESNVILVAPPHPPHAARTTKMGRAPVDGEYMHVVGNFSGVDRARRIMGMPWANRDGLREAIPPAYTEYIGAQLLEHVRQGVSA